MRPGGLTVLLLGNRAAEYPDELRIEVRARQSPELVQGLLAGQLYVPRSAAGHAHVRVGYREDAGKLWDLVTSQSHWVPKAVVALVMVQYAVQLLERQPKVPRQVKTA
jgi:hypothetical protein